MREVTFYVLTDDEFDKMASAALGKSYECVPDNEWDSDSEHTSESVTGDSQWHIERATEYIDNQKFVSLGFHSVLEYLVYKKILLPGNYMIEV